MWPPPGGSRYCTPGPAGSGGKLARVSPAAAPPESRTQHQGLWSPASKSIGTAETRKAVPPPSHAPQL